MTCEKSVEITAFLKGEVPEGERESLRLHFDRCAVCSEDLAKQERILRSLSSIDRVEASPTFTWRVREAFLRAHPEYIQPAVPDRRTIWESIWASLQVMPAWVISVAAHTVLLAVLAVLVFSHRWTGEGREEEVIIKVRRWEPRRGLIGHVAPDGPSPREYTPGAIPDPNREAFEDAMRGWRHRLAIDRAHAGFIASRKPQDSHAIRSALGWLARHQQPDGRWSAPAMRAEDGAEVSHSVGVTGLCLLAFLSDGRTSKSGDSVDTVKKGLDYLLSQQKASGLIGPDRGSYLYDHAIGALALLEAWMATREERLEAPASAAVNYSMSSQNATGGWGYASRAPDNDTSVGGWQILLLRLAEIQGNAGVLPSLVQGGAQVRAWTDTDGKVGYRAPKQFPNGPYALCAIGMLSHVLATPSPDRSLLEKQSRILLERSPIQGAESNDLYFAHFGSLALHQLGGSAWTRWWTPLEGKLLEAQRADGSWPEAFDRWHLQAGPVYTTSIATLILETPVRYPRLTE